MLLFIWALSWNRKWLRQEPFSSNERQFIWFSNVIRFHILYYVRLKLHQSRCEKGVITHQSTFHVKSINSIVSLRWRPTYVEAMKRIYFFLWSSALKPFNVLGQAYTILLASAPWRSCQAIYVNQCVDCNFNVLGQAYAILLASALWRSCQAIYVNQCKDCNWISKSPWPPNTPSSHYNFRFQSHIGVEAWAWRVQSKG
jgi:hypothetical protein